MSEGLSEFPVEFAEDQIKLDPILAFFSYDHLPHKLQLISEPFAQLAFDLVAIVPSNAERTVALRKLLESKDCAVRAFL